MEALQLKTRSCATSKRQKQRKGWPMAVEQRPISLREKRRRAAEKRFQEAKSRWTKATVAVLLGRGSEAEVGEALRELNLARRLLSALEATP